MTEFQKQVVDAVPRVLRLSEEEQEQILIEINRHEGRGFSVSDSAATVRCFEEINPELDEFTACDRIAAISKKYPVGGK